MGPDEVGKLYRCEEKQFCIFREVLFLIAAKREEKGLQVASIPDLAS